MSAQTLLSFDRQAFLERCRSCHLDDYGCFGSGSAGQAGHLSALLYHADFVVGTRKVRIDSLSTQFGTCLLFERKVVFYEDERPGFAYPPASADPEALADFIEQVIVGPINEQLTQG